MRLSIPATLAVLATVLSSLGSAHAQDAGPLAVRADDGRWTMAKRPFAASDVPRNSALFGISVNGSPNDRSAIVAAINLQDSPLRVGDLIDEVQLPGVVDRERQVNPGYWPYQVWSASDFYRLAARCVDGCLVRLRGSENTPWPRVFAYVLVGAGTGFTPIRGRNGDVVAFVDARTGERFGPAGQPK